MISISDSCNTERFNEYIKVVPLRSATMISAFFNTSKCLETEGAEISKWDAISPALIEFHFNISMISRRTGLSSA